jgi:hypothetical protein
MKFRCACLSLMLCFGAGVVALADGFELSGIFEGRVPTALVNDQIVGIGDQVGGYRVVEIGGDYVIIEDTKHKVTLHLKESKTAAPKVLPKPPSPSGATPPAKPPMAGMQSPSAPALNPAARVQVPEKAGRHLDRSMDDLRQADELLKSPVKYDELYAKAAFMCSEASSEAQTALSGVADTAARNVIKEHLVKIQKVQQAITRERADLNTRVRTAVANQQIFNGMTTQNVISSWGPPLTKTNVGTLERWAYKDANGYQRNLNFSKGILVSF